MDVNGDGTVDFEEFATWWGQNSTFVIKLKKAIHRQDDEIRSVWLKIDTDQNGTLNAEEIENMAELLGIQLAEEEIRAAMEEMEATSEGVSFEKFTSWWLSRSKIAAKIRSSAAAKNTVARQMFQKILRDSKMDNETIQVEDLMTGGRNAFGEAVSAQEARAIIDECVDHAEKVEGDSILVTEAVFESWWKSDSHHATRLREKRRSDMMMARTMIESFDTAKRKGDDYKAHKDAELDQSELEEMVRTLKLGVAVTDILESISSGVLLGEQKDHIMSDGVIDFSEFFDWLQSDNALAVRVKAAFVLKKEKDATAKEHPFPYIPWVSGKCRDIIYSWRFEGVMGVVIFANTVVMALAHHEQDITSPRLAAFITLADLIFSIIYVLEFAVKLFGMGLWPYFADHGNKFDFFCTAAFIAGLFMSDLSGSSAFRSLRVLVKCMRVARSAKFLLQNESVQTLLKTVLENGGNLLMLALFAVFMMFVFSIIGGHTLGSCHVHKDGTPLSAQQLDQLPSKNFFTFAASFQANFMIMTGQGWSDIMFDYTECAQSAWVYFVLSFCVMNFFM